MKNILSATFLAFFILIAPAMAQSDPEAQAAFTPDARGITVETDRYRAAIVNGALVSFLNKFTDEEYLRGPEELAPLLPHVPSGLGTQDGKEAFQAAGKIFAKGWSKLPTDLYLPNQHYPSESSTCEWKPEGKGGTLVYKGLTDGQKSFPDEIFTVRVEVDAATGDLLLTPRGESPRKGVYGANLTLAPTRLGISMEAPIFDGVRITSDMASSLWHNKWPDYWDYAFLALNGHQRGAVGIWAQDAELRYKDLFYLPLPEEGGIVVSLGTMNLPPFEERAAAEGVTWRFQAFDHGWEQAAARFRQWREKEIKLAKRPDWTRQVSFVNSGVSAQQPWLDMLSAYFEEKNLDRTVTFAPVIRAAAFDTRHWDNTPYKTFKDEMPAWKKSGAKLMAYLQPMIVWGVPKEEEAQDKEIQNVMAMHREANTRSVFQDPPKVKPYVDQHHLGHARWQRWFLDWVGSYIQDYGADGVYHDQSYPAPVDSRGLINGMTPPQGMADYFYKAATENPDSIHGSEHMNEVNTFGASLGIGSGILWGEAPDMRLQRIRHPSTVSNALHYPHAALFAFPHFSDIVTRGDVINYHWGMNLQEGRAELAGHHIQNGQLYSGKQAPFDTWRNELKLDRLRALLFVRHGLRPKFPEDADRNVLSYFQGASSEDFRYEKLPWGSRLVEIKDGNPTVHYCRAHGKTHAPGNGNGGGNVAGWLFYNAQGPSGFRPDYYYVLDPEVPQPDVYFSPAFEVFPEAGVHPSLYESYVAESVSGANFALLRIEPIPSVGNIIKHDKIFLHSPEAPKMVWGNGKEIPFAPKEVDGETVYEIAFQSPATLLVLLSEPAAGTSLSDLRAAALLKAQSSMSLDVFDPAWYSTQLKESPVVLSGESRELKGWQTPRPLFPGIVTQKLFLPVKAPEGEGGTFLLHFEPSKIPPAASPILADWTVNGVEQPRGANPLQVAFLPGETKIISVESSKEFAIAPEWIAAP